MTKTVLCSERSYCFYFERVPLKDPSGESVILPSAEFERITSTSRVLTQQEKEAMMEAYHRRREEELVGTLLKV